MKKACVALLLVTSLAACTPKQKASFMCRVKYGPDARAVLDKNGDAGCYRIGTAIHVTTKGKK